MQSRPWAARRWRARGTGGFAFPDPEGLGGWLGEDFEDGMGVAGELAPEALELFAVSGTGQVGGAADDDSAEAPPGGDGGVAQFHPECRCVEGSRAESEISSVEVWVGIEEGSGDGNPGEFGGSGMVETVLVCFWCGFAVIARWALAGGG